ncbi:MAG TPA: hypothetical protein VLL04_05545 [Rhizomicrobium sp.]|nr:hypothetical protein [Rhizomicrobium sp.]
MKLTIRAPLQQARIAALILSIAMIFLAPAAEAQQSRQAVCQQSWEVCMTSVEGKNWKPVYDRCVKARSACLGGEAYTPAIIPSTASIAVMQGEGSGRDAANADPATRAALCDKGQTLGNRARGDDSSCTLAAAADSYGQNFSLLGPGVPLSRIQRSSSVVKCAGGTVALFYPNGRIESCTLDNNGSVTTALTDYSGKVITCAARAVARFDAEGRVLSCGQF